ncbi:hypothetical protein glysoja_011706 [Glycine soja]|nr:hypothetical protein glysoja_011706 [Glycine soja]
MLKGKLKLPAPDKVRRVFPDRLGSLVAGFDEKGHGIEGSEFKLESGKELKPIQPGELGFHIGSDDDDDKETKIWQRFCHSAFSKGDKFGKVAKNCQHCRLSCYDLCYLSSSHDLWGKQLKVNRQKKYANLKEGSSPESALAFQFSLIILLNLRQSKHIWKGYEELSSTKRHKDNDVDGQLRRHEISHED